MCYAKECLSEANDAGCEQKKIFNWLITTPLCLSDTQKNHVDIIKLNLG